MRQQLVARVSIPTTIDSHGDTLLTKAPEDLATHIDADN